MLLGHIHVCTLYTSRKQSTCNMELHLHTPKLAHRMAQQTLFIRCVYQWYSDAYSTDISVAVLIVKFQTWL